MTHPNRPGKPHPQAAVRAAEPLAAGPAEGPTGRTGLKSHLRSQLAQLYPICGIQRAAFLVRPEQRVRMLRVHHLAKPALRFACIRAASSIARQNILNSSRLACMSTWASRLLPATLEPRLVSVRRLATSAQSNSTQLTSSNIPDPEQYPLVLFQYEVCPFCNKV